MANSKWPVVSDRWPVKTDLKAKRFGGAGLCARHFGARCAPYISQFFTFSFWEGKMTQTFSIETAMEILDKTIPNQGNGKKEILEICKLRLLNKVKVTYGPFGAFNRFRAV